MKLITDRLIVRPVELSDAQVISSATHNSFKELNQWMPWVRNKPSLEDTHNWLKHAVQDNIARTFLHCIITNLEGDKIYGMVALNDFDWTVPKAAIGYWAHTPYAGNGYITEAARALVQYAFDELELQRIELHCDSQNARSIAVANRLGFELEACLRCSRRNVNGELADTLVFVKFLS